MSEQRNWKRIRERLALHLPVRVQGRDTSAASRLRCLYDCVQKLFPSNSLSSTIRHAVCSRFVEILTSIWRFLGERKPVKRLAQYGQYFSLFGV